MPTNEFRVNYATLTVAPHDLDHVEVYASSMIDGSTGVTGYFKYGNKTLMRSLMALTQWANQKSLDLRAKVDGNELIELYVRR